MAMHMAKKCEIWTLRMSMHLSIRNHWKHGPWQLDKAHVHASVHVLKHVHTLFSHLFNHVCTRWAQLSNHSYVYSCTPNVTAYARNELVTASLCSQSVGLLYSGAWTSASSRLDHQFRTISFFHFLPSSATAWFFFQNCRCSCACLMHVPVLG